MIKHPVTKEVVTPSELAEVLATSTQTISFYINGKRKKYLGINMPRYSKWCLHQDIYEFILTQLEKRGMKIDRNI